MAWGSTLAQNYNVSRSEMNDNLSDEEIVTKINHKSLSDVRITVIDSIFIEEELPLAGNSPKDSLDMKFNEYTIVRKQIRLKPELVLEVFPEIVNYNIEKTLDIDYTSLVSYLLALVRVQQTEINELQRRITLIEEK